MKYYTIRYNEHNEPYIIEKNFGYHPKDDDSSSHWTWHITQRGINHLSKDFFGNPQKMPAYITHEQLEDLKAFNMLRRSDGTLIGVNPIYPSEAPQAQKSIRPGKPQRPPQTAKKRPAQPITPPSQKRPNVPPKPQVKPPVKPHKGFWAWLKSLFGGG